MQQVLNAKERTQAFWKFILFFLVAIVAIVLAVFFNYQVPKQENSILRERTSEFTAHSMTEQKFTAAMQETNSLLDSLDKPGVNVAYINQLVSNKLTELTTLQLQEKDNTSASKEDAIFLDIMVKYQQAKMKLINLGDASAQLDKAKADLNQCNAELNQARQTIRMYQSTNGGY
jgi:hypothetical protein